MTGRALPVARFNPLSHKRHLILEETRRCDDWTLLILYFKSFLKSPIWKSQFRVLQRCKAPWSFSSNAQP